MIRVGVAGWDYPDWEGLVYPSPAPRRFDRLAFLASYVDALELNVTFYRQPDAAAARSWVRRVAERPEFRFTAKLYRSLTHLERTPSGPVHVPDATNLDPAFLRDEAARYREGLAPLEEASRLGAVLAQFPQRFHDRDTSRRHLERLAETLRGLPLVAELRHRSWDHEDALKFLHGLGIGFCNIDQPPIGAALRPTGHVTSRIAYVRLHGRNAENWFREGAPVHSRYDYLYTTGELRPWAERAERLSERAEEVFVIANNHYRGKGPANALMLKAMLIRGKVASPTGLARAYRELASVARAEETAGPDQGRLFD
ncbi:MAG TPA: DUF72 domain-containing protein [Candidatus Cryosericum sp.]|nr:DUF72 domain-containing protein [Candidatus Cryosericum sp.]